MKLTLLLIPLILLSACATNKDTLSRLPASAIQVQQKEPVQKIISTISKDFGNGFILAQTDSETTLSHSGKIIKTWSHTPPKKIPFVWDEACESFYQKLNLITYKEREVNKDWKQTVWDNFGIEEQQKCIKENLLDAVLVKPTINSRFYLISQGLYESSNKWLYDLNIGKIFVLPIDGTISKIETGESGIYILSEGGRGNDGGILGLQSDGRVQKIFWNNEDTPISISTDYFDLLPGGKIHILYHEYDSNKNLTTKKDTTIQL